MKALLIARRLIREITRDHRTLAFFFLAPMIVMSLVYFALLGSSTARVALITEGTMDLFRFELERTLEDEKDIELVTPDIELPDNADEQHEWLYNWVRSGKVDAVLYLNTALLVDRFDGKRGLVTLYLEGSRPTRTAAALGAVKNAMDDLTAAMPVVIDASCSSMCANSVNNTTMELQEIYAYGNKDLDIIDFFLPVFPPFFVFFFTFILSAISFQRERVHGTLERLLISPVNFANVVLGYVLGFLLFSALQASIILSFVLYLIDIPFNTEQVFVLIVVTFCLLLVGLTLGLLASYLAKNEFQAIQFIPVIILPQIFLADMIWAIEDFPKIFQYLSVVLPLTHANQAMRDVLLKEADIVAVMDSVGILLFMFALLVITMGAVARASSRGRAR
jgi:ABC-2 type transport system permease protein